MVDFVRQVLGYSYVDRVVDRLRSHIRQLPLQFFLMVERTHISYKDVVVGVLCVIMNLIVN